MEDFWEIWEEEARKAAKEAELRDQDPIVQARREARRKADHERGVRLGWWDEEGNLLATPEEDDGEEEDEDDEPEEEIDE